MTAVGSIPRIRQAFILVMAIFLFSGFAGTLLYGLMPSMQDYYGLSYKGVSSIAVAYFAALVISSPVAGWWLKRIGYPRGISYGSLIAALGCALVVAATSSLSFTLLLLGFIVMGLGNSLVQVAGNIYALVLGSSASATSRLTFLQGFVATGMILAPLSVSWFLQRAQEQSGLPLLWSYLGMGILWLVMAVFAFFSPRNEVISQVIRRRKSLWRNPQVLFPLAALFCYIGVEIGVSSILVCFLAHPDVTGFSLVDAARFSTLFWVGLALGRFLGSIPLRYVSEPKALMAMSVVAILSLILLNAVTGWAVVAMILAIGLCDAIMFSTILSLGLKPFHEEKDQVGGIFFTAMLGGAVFPFLQGVLADSLNLGVAMLFPIAGYLIIAIYAWSNRKNAAPEMTCSVQD